LRFRFTIYDLQITGVKAGHSLRFEPGTSFTLLGA
jgi:hypothetical protein